MAEKKERKWFLLPEYEEEEKYLNEMARKGYRLKNINILGIYTFEDAPKEDMIYKIDFNPQKKENCDSYHQMYEDYGWEFVQDLNEYSYFRKLNTGNEEEMEIYSDNASKIEMMERVMKRKMLPILVIFLCCVVPQASRIAFQNEFSDSVSIGFYILWMVLAVVYIYLIARCTAGFQKLRKKYGAQ